MNQLLLLLLFAIILNLKILAVNLDAYIRYLRHFWALIRIYGPFFGPLVGLFGSRRTWRAEAQVIGVMDDEQALGFRDAVQGQCTMISVTVSLITLSHLKFSCSLNQAALLAQLAVTILSLQGLNQIHWIARAFLTICCISALGAVHYAVTQYITMGHLLTARQIRQWIRGGTGYTDIRISLPEAARQRLNDGPVFDLRENYNILSQGIMMRQPCEPCDLEQEVFDIEIASRRHFVKTLCFTPAFTAVLTMSAPLVLLWVSIISLIIALGVYFGFIWTRNDVSLNAGSNDDRNVFIAYIVSLGICMIVYSCSQLIQDDEPEAEDQVIERYLKDYENAHHEISQIWLEDPQQ